MRADGMRLPEGRGGIAEIEMGARRPESAVVEQPAKGARAEPGESRRLHFAETDGPDPPQRGCGIGREGVLDCIELDSRASGEGERACDPRQKRSDERCGPHGRSLREEAAAATGDHEVHMVRYSSVGADPNASV